MPSIKMEPFLADDFSLNLKNLDERTDFYSMGNFNILLPGYHELIPIPGYMGGIWVFDNYYGAVDVRVVLYDCDPTSTNNDTEIIIPAVVPAGSIYYAPAGSAKYLFHSLWADVESVDSDAGNINLWLYLPLNY